MSYPYRDPKCVYVADGFAMAGVIQSFLASHGISARVMDEATLGGLQGLTWMMPAVSIRGLELWVIDPADADRGRALVEEKTAEIKADAAARAERTDAIRTTCPECGHGCVFPGSRAGRTEHCPACRKYVDVPDPLAGPEDEFWRAGENEDEPE